MSVFLFAYRDWAFRLARDLDQIDRIYTPPGYSAAAKSWFDEYIPPIREVDPKKLEALLGSQSLIPELNTFRKEENILLFYGWSWLVPPCLTDDYLCICLHPSPLPKYRGGSPIQNQVIAGETTGGITLFKMGQGLDDGPIFTQRLISLDGSLSNILYQIQSKGVTATAQLLHHWRNKTLVFEPQNESQATWCKRRKPSDGQILPADTALEIYNKVRCLQDPYPNAFLVGADGKKIFVKEVDYEQQKS